MVIHINPKVYYKCEKVRKKQKGAKNIFEYFRYSAFFCNGKTF